jgi:hypothetical protein
MRTIIYRKSDLQCVGQLQSNTDFEWEIEHNVIPNFGGVIEDYESIETDVDKVLLYRDGDDVEAVETEPTEEEKEFLIKKELKQLDNEVSRLLEDMIAQGSFIVHQSKLDVIARKQELRQQLTENS